MQDFKSISSTLRCGSIWALLKGLEAFCLLLGAKESVEEVVDSEPEEIVGEPAVLCIESVGELKPMTLLNNSTDMWLCSIVEALFQMFIFLEKGTF